MYIPYKSIEIIKRALFGLTVIMFMPITLILAELGGL